MAGTTFLIYIFCCNELYISFNLAENVILKITVKISRIFKIYCNREDHIMFFFINQASSTTKLLRLLQWSSLLSIYCLEH